jgi:hypothetical protein
VAYQKLQSAKHALPKTNNRLVLTHFFLNKIEVRLRLVIAIGIYTFPIKKYCNIKAWNNVTVAVRKFGNARRSRAVDWLVCTSILTTEPVEISGVN